MRTTLCEILLLTDQDDDARQGLNTEANVVGREQDSGEIEKERESGRALLEMRDDMGNNKFDR
jgi:hypothetical protein